MTLLKRKKKHSVEKVIEKQLIVEKIVEKEVVIEKNFEQKIYLKVSSLLPGEIVDICTYGVNSSTINVVVEFGKVSFNECESDPINGELKSESSCISPTFV